MDSDPLRAANLKRQSVGSNLSVTFLVFWEPEDVGSASWGREERRGGEKLGRF